MTTTEQASTVQFAAYPLKQLRSWIKRCDRWDTLCANLSATQRTYESTGSTADMHARDAARTAWEKGARRRPSKTSKYHAYDYANAVNRYLDLGHDRPQTYAAIVAIVAAATEIGY